jgi:hypothetical protein
MLFYKNINLFKTTLHVGHVKKNSESYLNYYYSGISKNIVFYKFKYILYSLFKIKAYLKGFVNKTVGFLFILVFSETNQFLLASKFVETNFSLSKTSHRINLIFEPTGGFLVSSAARYLKQKVFEMPLFFSYSKTIILSFGDQTLPIMLKESFNKQIMLFGITDTNQKRVSTGVDYIIPGNDDSILSSYFIVLFFFNILLY